MAFETRTLDQLRLSPLRTRRQASDTEDTAALQASIASVGVILPLVVHRMRGSNRCGVLIGGRKYRALKSLVEAGKWPADRPIDVKLIEGKDQALEALTLHENLIRRDYSPAETFVAVARAVKRGATVEAIAAELGQPLIWVRQAARLGALAPELIAALEAGEIDVDQAAAFAATADQALQRDVWAAVQQDRYSAPPADIRRRLKVGDRELARLLDLVGAEAYRAAGGGIEGDLFDDTGARSRVTDEPLLRRLADAHLALLRDVVREAVSDLGLRFAAEPPRGQHGGWDHHLRLPIAFRPGQPVALPGSAVVAVIEIGNGGPEVSFWWESRRAKADAERATAHPADAPADASGKDAKSGQPVSAAPPIYTETSFQPVGCGHGSARNPAAEAIARGDHGLTFDGLQAFRSVRRSILRVLLLDDADRGGATGHDYLIWSLIRSELGGRFSPAARRADTGARPLDSADRDPVTTRAHLADQPEQQRWEAALARLARENFVTEQDPALAFVLFLNAPAATRNRAAAVCAGLSLERALNTPGYSLPAHDVLAHLTEHAAPADLRRDRVFAPTAGLLDLLPKQQRHALAEPFVEPKSFAAWGRLKAAELTRHVLAALTGASGALRFGKGRAAEAWVHPLLAFPEPSLPARADPPPADADDEQHDLETHLKEAAE